MNAVYLIDGKPHRMCDCDESSEACPKGRKRGLMACGFDRCMVPAAEVLVAGPGIEPASENADMWRLHARSFDAFLNELYAIMVDPCADGTRKRDDMMEALKNAALRDREAAHSASRPEIPAELYDGMAVYVEAAKRDDRVRPEHVSPVLDALSRLIRRRLKTEHVITDSERLSFLEKDVEEDPLLLFNDSPPNGNKGFRGLGLRCTERTLRQALDQLIQAMRPRPAPAWPFPTISKP